MVRRNRLVTPMEIVAITSIAVFSVTLAGTDPCLHRMKAPAHLRGPIGFPTGGPVQRKRFGARSAKFAVTP